MKNEKGMTLIEVIVAMTLLSIIATVFFRTSAFGYINLVNSNKFTKDSFEVQKDIENKINELKSVDVNSPGSKTLEKSIFGKTVKGHTITFDIKDDNVDTSNKHGEYTAFVPYIKITHQVPIIESVSLSTNDPKTITRLNIVNAKNQVDTNIKFTGNHKDGAQTNFLMNVYRWYISPPLVPYPTGENASTVVNAFINNNSNDFIIIKEWNASRKKQNYDFDDLSVVPNIESDYKDFNLSELKFSGPDKNTLIIDMLAGRFIVYSVTPYSTIGKMGEEVYSNPIYIEPVK